MLFRVLYYKLQCSFVSSECENLILWDGSLLFQNFDLLVSGALLHDL